MAGEGRGGYEDMLVCTRVTHGCIRGSTDLKQQPVCFMHLISTLG